MKRERKQENGWFVVFLVLLNIALLLVVPILQQESGSAVKVVKKGTVHRSGGIGVTSEPGTDADPSAGANLLPAKSVDRSMEVSSRQGGNGETIAASSTYFLDSWQWSNQITAVSGSSVVVGDFTNDSWPDLIISGINTTNGVIRAYTNNKTAFVINSSWGADLWGVFDAALALVDLNNDSRLDFVETGQRQVAQTPIARVYLNTGNSFAFNNGFSNGLSGVLEGSIAVGDINMDGRQDVVITGLENVVLRTRVYINSGTSLVYNSSWSSQLFSYGLRISGVSLADLDGDNRLDLLMFGQNTTGVPDRSVFINTGSTFLRNTTFAQNLNQLRYASLALGNLNGNSILDLFTIGETVGSAYTAAIHLGNVNGFSAPITGGLTPMREGNVVMGDITKDGRMDVATFGEIASATNDHKIYTHIGFGLVSNDSWWLGLEKLDDGSGAFVDVDNDSDLDYIFTGMNSSGTRHSKVHLNVNPGVNTLPSPPTVYTSGYQNGQLNLSWNMGSDDMTPAAELYYQLRVGTCSNCDNIVSMIYGGSTNPTQGFLGNMQQRREINLNVPLQTYYWAVRSIDNGLLAGPWGPEQIYNPISISVALSPEFNNGLVWNVSSLPAIGLPAVGNNDAGPTFYNVSITATNTLVDLYINASGDLSNGVNIIPLANEKFKSSLIDNTVSTGSNISLSTSPILVNGGIDSGSTVHFKFFLDVPSGQQPGLYTNQVYLIAVQQGQTP